MNISQLIHTSEVSVSKFATYADMQQAFLQTELDFVPVLEENGELVGSVCKTEFDNVYIEDFQLEELIDDKALVDYFHILETIREFLKVERTVLPVVDEEGFYLGICFLQDVQYHFNRIVGLIEGGSLLVIETQLQNYSLVDVAKIVESNQAKILTHYISTHPESTQIEITMVLNGTEISDIISTFSRYNYQVVYSSIASEQENLLKERYDSLMHYLDI